MRPWPWGRARGRAPLPPRCPQFVPFRDYVDEAGSQVRSLARLAKDVLAEIPEQLLSYMRGRGIEPRRNAAQ